MVVSIATLLFSFDWPSKTDTQTTAEERIIELEREIAHLKGTVHEPNLVANDGTVSAPVQPEPVAIPVSEQDRINHIVESMRWTMTVRGLMNPCVRHVVGAAVELQRRI